MKLPAQAPAVVRGRVSWPARGPPPRALDLPLPRLALSSSARVTRPILACARTVSPRVAARRLAPSIRPRANASVAPGSRDLFVEAQGFSLCDPGFRLCADNWYGNHPGHSAAHSRIGAQTR